MIEQGHPWVACIFEWFHFNLRFTQHLNVSGFGDRLLSEVKKLAPKDIKIRVSDKSHFRTSRAPFRIRG
jgi:hypothetical protein